MRAVFVHSVVMERIPRWPAAALVIVLESLILLQVSVAIDTKLPPYDDPDIPAGGVTIGGNQSGCSGFGIACYNIKAGVCCKFGVPLIPYVTGLPKCSVAFFYREVNCTKLCTGVCGPDYCNDRANNECNKIQSAKWDFDNSCPCGKRGNASETSPAGSKAKACTSTMLPNAVTYFSSTGTSKGAWVLDTGSDKLQETVDQLEKLSTEQQEAWMKAAGATYSEANLDDQLTLADSKV